MVIERKYINDLRIAWGQGRGHFLSICIQMILPAIWLCVENSNMTFCSYWNKDRLASPFHLFHLSLIGFVGIVVCNPSHQKAFYMFLLAMSDLHCVWSNQLFFFFNGAHSNQLLPPLKEMLCFWILLFYSEIKHLCYHILKGTLPIYYIILKLMRQSFNSCSNYSAYPLTFKTEIRGHLRDCLKSLI